MTARIKPDNLQPVKFKYSEKVTKFERIPPFDIKNALTE